MLTNANTLKDYALVSLDGEIGRVNEFLFDDQHWAVRYLVADTGGWLAGRQVLISPYALGPLTRENESLTVTLTKDQIQHSPPLASHQPVSRQFEDSYYAYYRWPMYWSGPYMWGSYPGIIRDQAQWQESADVAAAWDPHLRSTRDMLGHHIQASDGEIGHVEDFVVDDETWAIRYLVVDTRNWWPGKQVLVSPQWIERVSWAELKVVVALPRDLIRESPEYNGLSLLTREYETRLHLHYARQGYWVDEQAVQPA